MSVSPNSKSEALLSEVLKLPNDVRAFAVMATGCTTEAVDMAAKMRYDEKRAHYNIY